MKQGHIFKPTLKFSQKTSVSNVNVSNDNFRVIIKLAPRLRGKIRLDSCKKRYYTNNTQGSHSIIYKTII